jgi:hypothetical protein
LNARLVRRTCRPRAPVGRLVVDEPRGRVHRQQHAQGNNAHSAPHYRSSSAAAPRDWRTSYTLTASARADRGSRRPRPSPPRRRRT